MDIIVNDIDGHAAHTVAHGPLPAVLAEFPAGHPVRGLIQEVVASGVSQTRTYQIGGESYTTRVAIEDAHA